MCRERERSERLVMLRVCSSLTRGGDAMRRRAHFAAHRTAMMDYIFFFFLVNLFIHIIVTHSIVVAHITIIIRCSGKRCPIIIMCSGKHCPIIIMCSGKHCPLHILRNVYSRISSN